MQISIANAIQVARRIGAAAAEVITTNLKMWLGFETSETLGREIVTGTNSNMSGSNSWVSDIGSLTFDINDTVSDKMWCDFTSNNQRVKLPNKLIVGKYYLISLTARLNSGTPTTVQIGGGFTSTYPSPEVFTITPTSTTITYTGYVISDSVDLSIGINALDNNGSDYEFGNISVKELTQITPDKSGNNNVGELFTGKALEFDGNVDSVTFSSYPTSIKSVVFWYKPLASVPFDAIIWLGGTNRGIISISNNQGTINCTNLLGKVIYVDGVQTESVTLNQWQRVVINFPSKTLLGLSFAKAGLNYGNCQLSDVQFYNEDLSLDDIAYDYANPQNLLTDREGTSVLLADLRGYWHLSEGAGSLVYDNSGGSHNGTISGADWEPAQPRIPQLGMMNFSNGAVATGVTLIPDPNNTSQDIDGNAVRDRLNSFNLDGSGYSSVANSSTLQFGTDAFTIQAWIKPFSLASNNRILTKGVTGNGEFMISVGGDGLSARVFAKDSNGNFFDTSNDFSSLTINSWQMITVIIDTPNDQILFYKNDGNVEPKTGASWTGNFNSTQPITIGNTSSVSAGQFFDGLVSDALVYDRALTSTEVEKNYNAGLSAHTN